jgi:hypothetical protein
MDAPFLKDHIVEPEQTEDPHAIVFDAFAQLHHFSAGDPVTPVHVDAANESNALPPLHGIVSISPQGGLYI